MNRKGTAVRKIKRRRWAAHIFSCFSSPRPPRLPACRRRRRRSRCRRRREEKGREQNPACVRFNA